MGHRVGADGAWRARNMEADINMSFESKKWPIIGQVGLHHGDSHPTFPLHVSTLGKGYLTPERDICCWPVQAKKRYLKHESYSTAFIWKRVRTAQVWASSCDDQMYMFDL